MLPFNSLKIADFSGGLTDAPLEALPNQYAKADNILFNDQGHPISRFGSAFYDASNPLLPTGNAIRVRRIFNYKEDDALFLQAGTKLYRYSSGWTELQGPSSTAAFASLTASGRLSSAEWKGHLFITGPDAKAVKIYKDSGGTYRLRTAGLPLVAETANYTLATVTLDAVNMANEIRTDMLAHFASVTSHRAADTVGAALIGSAATDLASLLVLTGQLLQAYVSHYKDTQTASTYHYKETDNSATVALASAASQVLSNTDIPTDIVEAVNRLHDLKSVYNTHEGNDDIHNHVVATNIVSSAFLSGVDAGPRVILNYQTIYDYANLIKAQYNAHLASGGTATTAHSTAADATNTVSSANATTAETLEALIWEIRHKYTAHDNDAELAAAWSYHVAQESSNHSLTPKAVNAPSAAPYNDYRGGLRAGQWSNMVTQLNTLKTAINGHMVDLTSHYTTNPTTNYITHTIPGGDLTLADYIYAFVYFYEYTVGTETFQDFGPVLYKQASDVISIDYESLAISQIPTLANTANTHYDTSTLKVKIYRTTNNGTVYYLVGDVTNGTTTFTDDVSDTELVTRETLYVEGGVLENEEPPESSYVHICGDTAYWVPVDFPNRILQAKRGDPDSVPSDTYLDLPNAVVGVSSVKGIVVGFNATRVYRIENSFDDLGRGQMTPVAISEVTGCIAPESIVQIENGILFAGNDQFYFTDGYKVTPVANEWRTTYANFIRDADARALIQGVYNSKEGRAYFTVSEDADEADSWAVVDLNFPLTQNSRWSIANNGESFRPSAIGVFNGNVIRGDSRGYVFYHSPSFVNDPLYSASLSASDWTKAHLPYDFRSAAFDFGSTQIIKWVTTVTSQFRGLTNLSIQLVSCNDDGRVIANLSPIRYRGHIYWNQPGILWGASGILWNDTQLIDEKRFFPSGSLRCAYKQIRLEPAYVTIYNSDTYGSATVSAASNTATLPTLDWPSDVENYYISFDDDNYDTEFLISDRTSDSVITFLDPGAVSPADGTRKWLIKGYPKNEKFEFLGWNIKYAPLGETQSDAGDATGANV